MKHINKIKAAAGKKGDGNSVIDLLIIADDFTGAIDTGVQFAEAGTEVRIVTKVEHNYRDEGNQPQVLVMDTETRHLEKEKAYDVVFKIVKQAECYGIPYIYKKTDSALRGNIGSELTAVLEASKKEILPFLPAFPQMGRTTREGVQYIHDLPVEQSVFGEDPFEPVVCSYIPDIIHLQSSIPVETEEKMKKGKRIIVYDAWEYEHLIEVAKTLYAKKALSVMAGCAGFASVLPQTLGLQKKTSVKAAEPSSGFLTVCGSLNPVTQRQIRYAEKKGFLRLEMTAEQKLEEEYWKTEIGKAVLKKWFLTVQKEKRCILDTTDRLFATETFQYAEKNGIEKSEVRVRIVRSLGIILKFFLEHGLTHTILLTGGDTLLGFMDCMGVSEVIPICELRPGTVLSKFSMGSRSYQIVSKSGGFGNEELLVEISDLLLKGR